MCLVASPRSAFKQALTSGRVYKQHLNVYDPAPAGPGDVPVDFQQYTRPMSDYEWITFQRDERAYRRTLDTKLLQVRSTFAVTSGVQRSGADCCPFCGAHSSRTEYSPRLNATVIRIPIPVVEVCCQDFEEVPHRCRFSRGYYN